MEQHANLIFVMVYCTIPLVYVTTSMGHVLHPILVLVITAILVYNAKYLFVTVSTLRIQQCVVQMEHVPRMIHVSANQVFTVMNASFMIVMEQCSIPLVYALKTELV